MVVDSKIGAYLKEARLNVPLTQEAAAKLAGMSRQQVNRIENGESGTEWSTVEKLVDAYRCNKAEAVRVFTRTEETKLDVRLARQIEGYLMQIGPDKRAVAERLLVDHARGLSELLAV